VARLGGVVEGLVPESILARVVARMNEKRNAMALPDSGEPQRT
jgi:pantetheine-phosphate adenylyltransferase